MEDKEKIKRSNTMKDLTTFQPKDNKPYVFISYKSDDWELVLNTIVRKLVDDYGLRIYYDINFDKDNQAWLDNMLQAMQSRQCKAILSFVSLKYVSSYACAIEMLAARSNNVWLDHNEKKLEVIPIIVDSKYSNIDEIVEATSDTPIGGFDEWKEYSMILDQVLDSEENDKETKKWANHLKSKGGKANYYNLARYIKAVLGKHERKYSDQDLSFYDNLHETIKDIAKDDVFDESLKKHNSNSASSDIVKNVVDNTANNSFNNETTKTAPEHTTVQPTVTPPKKKREKFFSSKADRVNYSLFGEKRSADSQSEMMYDALADGVDSSSIKETEEVILPEAKKKNLSGIRYKYMKATMVETPQGEFIIEKDSVIRTKVAISCPNNVVRIRDESIKNGSLKNESEDMFIVVNPISVTSKSAAACFVSGGSTAGSVWTVISDQTSKTEKTLDTFASTNNAEDTIKANIDITDKKTAIDFLTSHGFKLADSITWAKRQDNKPIFWANPSVDSVHRDWTIILGDQFKRTVTVLFVPANTFGIKGDGVDNELVVRSDRPNRIDLSITSDTLLIDETSKNSFLPFIVSIISY